MLDIKGLFIKDAIIRHLTALPPIKTPVMDTIYTDRPQEPLAMVGSDQIKSVAKAMPVIKRGAPSIPATSQSVQIEFYEPLSIRPHVMVTAPEINNLKLLSTASRELWARNKVDLLRKIVRKTAEGEAAVSLNGTFTWPVQLEGGGFEDWSIAYGSIITVTPDKLWDASDCKLVHVFDLFQAMEEAIQDNGYGGSVVIWAGKTAYSNLFALAEKFTSTAKIRVEVSDQGINIGGYLVRRRSERNYNPKTQAMVPTVADKDVKMIALDAGMKMPYCAVDDLDANLLPMPFFVKPIQISDLG